MDEVKTGLDADVNPIAEDMDADVMQAEQLPLNEEVAAPTIGVRLNFNNGMHLKFEFADASNTYDVSTEISEFLQSRVALLDIKSEKGKRAFKASDVLPRRKCTVDIVYDGKLVRSSLMGVPLQPWAIFDDNGVYFFKQLLRVISDTKKAISKPTLVEIGF